MKRRSVRDIAILAGLFAGYVAAGKLGLRLAFVHPSATAVWAPTGIALAAVLVLGPRVWPVIFLGAFVVNITTEGSLLTVFGIASGNTLEAVVGAWLVNRFANGRRAYDRAPDVFRAAGLAGLLSTTISATLGVTSLALGGSARWPDFGAIWTTWWLGDIAGSLVVAPALVLWSNRPDLSEIRRRPMQGLLLLGGVAAVQSLVFGNLLGIAEQKYPLEYMVVPVLILIALQFSPREAATATLLAAAVAVLGTSRGLGPFTTGSPNESLLLLGAYSSVISLTILALAAEVAGRRRIEQDRARLFAGLESERLLLDSVVQHFPEGVIVWHVSGELLYCNSSAERILGGRLPMVGLAGRVLDLQGEELSQQRWPRFRALAGETVVGEDLLYVEPKGQRRVLRTSAVPVRLDGGQIFAVLATYHDVTQRRRANEALQFLAEAGAAMGSSLDSATTMGNLARLAVPRLADWCWIDLQSEAGTLQQVAVAHSDPKKLELARELARRYPPEPDGPSGSPHVIRTGHSEIMEEVTSGLLRSSARDEEHLALLRELGFLSYMCVPLRGFGRIFGAMTFVSSDSGRRFDATDLRLAEQLASLAANALDNVRLYAEAERAIRVRDEFLSVASHELRTPLNAAQLLVETVGEQVSPEQATGGVAESLAQLRGSIGRIGNLIEELLDVSLISAGRLALELRDGVDLGSIAGEVASRFDEDLRRAQCRLNLRVKPVLGRWDPRRLDQVVTNLLSNAIKYGPGRSIDLEVESTDSTAIVRVRDEGIGIPPEDQSRIFRQFERAASGRLYRGMGLGLWIVRQIVEAFSGSVRVESEPGVGSTFIVEIPTARR
jgi:PAS domain S-box-containing protein